MDRVVLQVPMSKTLRQQAEAVVVDYGFSSLQEIIRVILNKLAKRELTISIQEEEAVTYLSPAAEKRYARAIKDIKKGRNVTTTKNVDELLRLLRE